MLIPSIDEWPRAEFLRAREAQMQAQKARDKALGARVEYLEAPEGVVLCDSCNARIEDPLILLVEFGRRVACRDCFQRSYASGPVQYRRLRVDGTLGEVVDGP